VDHIVSRRLDGTDDMENLACACIMCNRAKTVLISGLDEFGRDVRLFNPRTERWEEHFQLVGARIEGLTSTGVVTLCKW
jgi:5-methylcytosine-specific restriction endonuclease McrA